MVSRRRSGLKICRHPAKHLKILRTSRRRFVYHATDNEGKFAGLVPNSFTSPGQGRQDALLFAQALVDKLGKGFCAETFELVKPGVPQGATDLGVHCSTHNSTFNGGPLSEQQIDAIRSCNETFTLTANLTDFKVLVGAPSNDEHTGVIGYVALLLAPESLEAYNTATKVYDGIKKEGNLAHVSICGWNIKGYDTTSEGRKAFGLITADGDTYPDGQKFYAKGCFPQKIAQADESSKERSSKRAKLS